MTKIKGTTFFSDEYIRGYRKAVKICKEACLREGVKLHISDIEDIVVDSKDKTIKLDGDSLS